MFAASPSAANTFSAGATQVLGLGLAPADDREPAISATLTTKNYLAVVWGVNNTQGNALVEV
jgi:hypothetical protein